MTDELINVPVCVRVYNATCNTSSVNVCVYAYVYVCVYVYAYVYMCICIYGWVCVCAPAPVCLNPLSPSSALRRVSAMPPWGISPGGLICAGRRAEPSSSCVCSALRMRSCVMFSDVMYVCVCICVLVCRYESLKVSTYLWKCLSIKC